MDDELELTGSPASGRRESATGIGGPSIADLDIRLLRAFLAVAEELHFTRAAGRLFVAQQALSRDVRRLESQLGVPLFERTTRRVALTPEGERLRARAAELVALHDELLDELAGPARPVVVDLMSEGRRTARRVLDRVRAAAPDLEVRGRYGGGMAASIRRLRAGELDVAFGRASWRGARGGRASHLLRQELVRYEPLAVLLPDGHPLAGDGPLPLAALAGHVVDANAAHGEAPEWTDLGAQLLALARAEAAPPHPPAIGREDQADHLARQGLPILTTIDHDDVAGGVLRRLVEPTPIYAWSIVWRRGAPGSAVAALRGSARELAAEESWLRLPDDAWLPEPEALEMVGSGR